MSPIENVPFYLQHSHGISAKLIAMKYFYKKIAQKTGLYYPKMGDTAFLRLHYLNIYFNYLSPEIVFFKEIFVDNAYEQHQDFLPEGGWTVLDIGANIGMFAMHISQRVKNGKIICIEPNPFVFALLLKNIRNNSLNNIFPFQKAMSKEPGQTNFSFYEYSTGSGKIRDLQKIGENNHHQHNIQVCVTNLDGFVEEHNITNYIDLIKLDVEGEEMEVLRGGKQVLKKTKRIVMEIHEPSLIDKIDKLLMSHNFVNVLAVPPNIFYYLNRGLPKT